MSTAPASKLAIQMYSLQAHCQNPDDLDAALAKVKAIGYKSIQISGIPASIPPETVKALVDKHGLFVCATHEGLSAITGDAAALAAKMRLWGCDFTALGHPGGDFWNPEGPARLAGLLEDAARRLRAHGIALGYHNHADELAKFTRKTFLDELYDRTTLLKAEIDTHWIARGGGSPAKWVRRVAGRMPVVHFKDMAFVDKQPQICEIGQGNLDWPEIISACAETGVRWYVVEQDSPSPWGGRDIFESIALSFDFLRSLGVD